MASKINITIQGHPWDLWGLTKLFDGSDTSHTKVHAEKPKGTPTFNPADPSERERFRVHGYDVFANVTSDELIWDDAKGKPDLRELRRIAIDIVERMNGIAILLDPEYSAAKILYLSFTDDDGGAGSTTFGDWTKNKGDTALGKQDAHLPFSKEILALSRSDQTIKFVLDAIALPRTWASLYLIYDAIAADVGGVHPLRKKGWVSETDLSAFSKTANKTRNIAEGARHFNDPQEAAGPHIPLFSAYALINQLAVFWLASKIPNQDNS